jgi:hypothetical protein
MFAVILIACVYCTIVILAAAFTMIRTAYRASTRISKAGEDYLARWHAVRTFR